MRTLLAALLAFAVLPAIAQVSFQPRVPYTTANNPRGIQVADLDGDGDLDVVVAAFSADSVRVFRNNGSGGMAAGVDYPVGDGPSGVALADINGDGSPDIAVANYDGDSVSTLLNNGNGTFAAASTIATARDSATVLVADIDGDGRVDLLVPGRGQMVFHPGNGDGTFGPRGATATLSGTDLVTAVLADFNRDGIFDVAIPRPEADEIQVLLGAPGATFGAPVTYPAGANPYNVAAGDVNGDGIPDLVASDYSDDSISVLLGVGDGTFLARSIHPSVVGRPYHLTLADLDGDGHLDVLAAGSGSNAVVVLTGRGDGTFAPGQTFAAGTSAGFVAVGDLDGDGRPDVVVSNFGASRFDVLLNATPRVPLPPTGVTAAAGNAQVSVAFTPDTSDPATLPLLDFTATCGGVSVTGTSSPIVVAPLVNGTAYACTVVSRNARGTSAPSAPSAAATPMSPSIVALATSGSPSLAGASVTFTATVTGDNPTGSVSFSADAAPIAGCTGVALVAGTAQCTTTFSTGGTRAIGADYSGDAANQPSSAMLAGGQVVIATTTAFTGPTATGSGNATVTFTGGGLACTFAPAGTGPMESAFFIPVTGHPKSPPAGSAPAAVVFTHGLLDFVLTGCTPGGTVTLSVTYPSPIPAGAQYWKYGPTAADPTPHWYVLPATIAGNTVTFAITDGGLGDDDLAANGTIVDQGGPGTPAGAGAMPVPTLSQWALMLLALLAMAIAAPFLRHDRATARP